MKTPRELKKAILDLQSQLAEYPTLRCNLGHVMYPHSKGYHDAWEKMKCVAWNQSGPGKSARRCGCELTTVS